MNGCLFEDSKLLGNVENPLTSSFGFFPISCIPVWKWGLSRESTVGNNFKKVLTLFMFVPDKRVWTIILLY